MKDNDDDDDDAGPGSELWAASPKLPSTDLEDPQIPNFGSPTREVEKRFMSRATKRWRCHLPLAASSARPQAALFVKINYKNLR